MGVFVTPKIKSFLVSRILDKYQNDSSQNSKKKIIHVTQKNKRRIMGF